MSAPTPSTPPAQSSGCKVSTTAWFTSEIQQMMHGFGDVRKPLAETASLIEQIIHGQMTRLVQQAAEAASLRQGRFIGLEDFLFLLRRDKLKLQRLIRYMEVRDLKSTMYKQADQEDDSTEIIQDGKGRRSRLCHDFLSTIDQTGELVALCDSSNIDEIKHERNLRAEMQSRGMDAAQYKDFCEARQTSFSRRYKSPRFREWITSGLELEIKPNVLAMEVLGYMAYEAVAQIVDLSLIVKHDKRARLNDPIKQMYPHIIANHDPLDTQNLASISSALASQKKEPTSPLQSPTSESISDISGQQSSGNSPKKAKKRKKSGASASLEMTSIAIQQSEVREAIRRYGRFVGPFIGFTKFSNRLPRDVMLLV